MRRPRLLIIGCGDVGMRVVRLLGRRWRVLALTTDAGRRGELRALGAVPLVGDLDRPPTLARLAGLADAVLHLAPPPGAGSSDPRTAHLLQALARHGRVQRLVYASTSGVYGDAGGALLDETRAVAPATDRARRRVDAERRVRWFGQVTGARVTLLRGPAQRAINVCDDTELMMGDYFDLAARLSGLPPPPRVSRDEARAMLSPMQLSFMAESRRLDNRRLKRELRLRLLYPTVADGLAGLVRSPAPDAAPSSGRPSAA